ncbi:MAG: glycosyltransferase family 2 protein [Actinomycetota bacterium]
MADLDVVIVNYNAGGHLLACLGALDRAAAGTDLDVVIVDNASRDGSAERALEVHPAVRLVRNEENVGFAAAADQGIHATNAPWVFVVNPDAMVIAGTFAEVLTLADARSRVAIIGPLVRETDGTVYPSARRIPKLADALGHALIGPFSKDNRFTQAYTLADWDRTSEREVDWVSGSCMFLRRDAVDRVGAFDPGYFMYAEDADLCTRMRREGWRVLFTPVMEVRHERGVSTRGNPRMVWEHSRSIYRYVRKFVLTGWKRPLLPVAWLVVMARAALVTRGRTR